MGIHGQIIYVNPQSQLVVVVTSAWKEAWNYTFGNEFYLMMESIEKLLATSSSA